MDVCLLVPPPGRRTLGILMLGLTCRQLKWKADDTNDGGLPQEPGCCISHSSWGEKACVEAKVGPRYQASDMDCECSFIHGPWVFLGLGASTNIPVN
jgi:hypothetical protein